ncbi:MAG: DotU family type IV/VI secretion system protein [Pirellulaceae bacterium]
MTPKFARAVDPIFICVLDLLDRIDRGQQLHPADEKARIQGCFDKATALLGNSDEWQHLAKYALIAWIDAELAILRPWGGREWWGANSLELDYWGQGLANVEFYQRATAAAQLPSKDAIEVFYVCVMLGFRGFYENSPEDDKIRVIEGLGLPADFKSWTRQNAMAIRLRLERPPISDARRPADVAPPRFGKQTLMGTTLLLAIAAGVTLGMAFVIWFSANTGG